MPVLTQVLFVPVQVPVLAQAVLVPLQVLLPQELFVPPHVLFAGQQLLSHIELLKSDIKLGAVRTIIHLLSTL